MFTHRHESEAAKEFDAVLDEVIEEFESQVKVHMARLQSLREALRDR